MIELGEFVTDGITGFEGVATARIEYFGGSTKYFVEPRNPDEQGRPIEGRWIEESRLS